eukprot:SAG31_NODE_5549_length_2465_cov_1.931530_2_plen_94_part_00
MEVAAEIGEQARKQRQQPIIDAFNAVDDGDGVMTYTEFEEAVKKLLPDVSNAALMRMFRDALQCSKVAGSPNALTPTAFADCILSQQGYAARS